MFNLVEIEVIGEIFLKRRSNVSWKGLDEIRDKCDLMMGWEREGSEVSGVL